MTLKINRPVVGRYFDTLKVRYRYRVMARYFDVDTIYPALIASETVRRRWTYLRYRLHQWCALSRWVHWGVGVQGSRHILQ